MHCLMMLYQHSSYLVLNDVRGSGPWPISSYYPDIPVRFELGTS